VLYVRNDWGVIALLLGCRVTDASIGSWKGFLYAQHESTQTTFLALLKFRYEAHRI
jgi:hypothetical protein